MEIVPALLTTDQTAAYLVVDRRTLFDLDDAGEVPAPVLIGKRKRWVRAELEAWIAAKCPRRKDWSYRP